MKKSMWKKCLNKLNCGKLCAKNRTKKYVDINYKQLEEMRDKNRDIILLDVRSYQEYSEGYINGAILIPLYELEKEAERKIPNKNSTIIVYCSSGIRSIRAIEILYRKGYNNLYNLEGGML